MNKTVETIETERLFLRGITEEDTAEIVAWRSAPDVYRFFKSPHKITAEEHLKWYRENYLHNELRYDWICIEKDTEQKIGVFGLMRKGATAEVNYLLCSAAMHKGYATEAIQRIIRFSADVWDIHRIIAEIHKDNEASIALVKRMGFSLQSDNGFVIYSIET